MSKLCECGCGVAVPRERLYTANEACLRRWVMLPDTQPNKMGRAFAEDGRVVSGASA
jgi:hypothetical protein